MSGMVRVGRGGAGNFISQKDVQEAEKAQNNNDPEAQRPPPSPSDGTAALAPEAPVYVRSGRGGAGNFAEPPSIDESKAREEVVGRTKAAVDASQAGKLRTGLSGRGGAGNWFDHAAANGQTDDADKDADDAVGPEAKQQQIEERVAHDIEAMLPPPPKTYHQHDRDLD